MYRARKILDEKKSDLGEEERTTSRRSGIGAVNYADLSQ